MASTLYIPKPPTMNRSQITKLIELLEHARKRPGMYIGKIDHICLNNYLNGIYEGFRLLGFAPDLFYLNLITRERGWKDDTSFGAYPYMKEKGLSEAEIVDEELAIHIEMWRRLHEVWDDEKQRPDFDCFLKSIAGCRVCWLMSGNEAVNISYVPILPKPHARFIFVGRDPSPRTVGKVGERGGKSVFINEIFRIVEMAGVAEEDIYITDLCKCHWRTSVGKPLPGTENRKQEIDSHVANTCIRTWLKREIEYLRPQLIIFFGDEGYKLLHPFITNPNPAPRKFSATRGKSILDAETWFAINGPLTITFGEQPYASAFLRHAGNIIRLPQTSAIDKRRHYYEQSVARIIQLLQEGKHDLG